MNWDDEHNTDVHNTDVHNTDLYLHFIVYVLEIVKPNIHISVTK